MDGFVESYTTMTKKALYSKKLNIFLLACLFILLLTILRISWTNILDIPEGAPAERGTIDLREVNTSTNFKMKLGGEWAFYPNVLIPSNNFDQYAAKSDKVYSYLPEAWNQYFENEEATHYGTYHLRILKDNDIPQLYGISIPEGLSAYEVYINGHLIGGIGSLATDDEYSAAIILPTIASGVAVQISDE